MGREAGMMGCKRPNILVVGSFVMDLILITDRVPEDGETVIGKSFQSATGGKGANQALQAQRLGCEVTMVGRVGDDAFGRELTNALKLEGVDVTHVRESAGCASGVGNVILARRPGGPLNNRIIVAPGANMQLSVEDVAFLSEDIQNYDMVLLQLEIPMDVNEAVLRYAAAAGVPVMLNPAPYQPLSDEAVNAVSYLCPNETEAAYMLGFTPSMDENGVSAADSLRIRTFMKARGLKKLLLTLGEHGAACITQDASMYCAGVAGVRPVDPTAAGDSFLGAFCMARCMGYEDQVALHFANRAAAITVCGMGAQPSLPTLSGVMEAMSPEDRARFEKLNALLPEANGGPTDKGRSAYDAFVRSAARETRNSLEKLDYHTLNAVAELILDAKRKGNRLHVSGIGKPAHIAGYAASLLSSTGTPAYFLHGTEAVHGSCGQLVEGDVVIFISNSGETAEMKAGVSAIKNNGCFVIGVSGNENSWLAKESTLHLPACIQEEGGPLNRAPRNSILAETIVLQALSVLLQAEVGWSVKEYIRRHPGGTLGKPE